MRSTCIALFVLNVAYCALALFEPRLPGWKMFASVDRIELSMRDRDGADVDLRAYLPRGAKIVDRAELRDVVRFICERHRARAPFVFEERGVRVRVGGDCDVHAPR